MSRSLRVFLCHTSQDKPAVRELYNALKGEGWIDPWLDKANILPGQDWEMVIEKAVDESDVVIICLSNQSVTKEGFVQREIRYSYDIALEKPEDTIFLIPLRLDDCIVPRKLRSLHWVDYFGHEKDEAYSNLLEAMNVRYQQKVSAEEGQREQEKQAKKENELTKQLAAERAAREKAEQEARIEREARLNWEREHKETPVKQNSISRTDVKPAPWIEKKKPVPVVPVNQQKRTFSVWKWTNLLAAIAFLIFLSVWGISTWTSAQEATTEIATEAPTEAQTTEPTEIAPSIGSPEHPIKILFVPSVDANVIVTGGEVMAQSLNEITGLTFEVVIPTSYAATVEEMCASPADSMAFIPGLGYAIASQQCGVNIAFKAIRLDYPVYWAEYIVARNSNIQTLADLNGKKWGYSDQGSTSGYMIPLTEFIKNGITPGEQVQTGGHNQTVTAVYNGEVDFGTVYYSVPLTPDGSPLFTYDDFLAGSITELAQYEIPAESIANCAPDAEGKKLLCDGYRIMDARASIRADAHDVIQKVRILAISQAVPNDTLSFSADFPADVRAQIEQALVAFSQTQVWDTSIGSNDFYGWSGIAPAEDAEYDFVRAMVEASDYKLSE